MKRSWRKARRALGYVAATSALLAGPAALPASAHTAGGSHAVVTCVGGETIRLQPGLTLQARHSRISGYAGYTCTGTDPEVKWAKSVIEGAGEASCLSLDSTAVEWITWNTGEHSRVFYRTHHLVEQLAGQTVSLVEGRVVEGRFKGRTVASPGLQLTLSPLDCATDRGVEAINGPTTLVFA
ncbi:hypothetical protein ACFOSC_04185 [Streptantibioticus rubrisoli]|uniref:Ig-like domain-containing protein n=1 Tax=Streptantibioticus rubrisoli TaxID=1387313 RepID=A0ABT1PI00_9ACTN|nr:hypothetical protein [Streptantibioticus rubrisoli]MCQ4044990.1 hypothetical protein [Streptantibioticus rubrisoli]